MINWQVRFKNPVFWFTLICAIASPALAGAGLVWSDMVTWDIVWQVAVQSLMNPVTFVAMLGAVWGVINDPTTGGAISDSAQAMTYTAPKVDGKHVKYDYIDNEDEI